MTRGLRHISVTHLSTSWALVEGEPFTADDLDAGIRVDDGARNRVTTIGDDGTSGTLMRIATTTSIVHAVVFDA